jgi:hypothetical protein
MRIPLPLGLAAAVALVGVSLAPASSNLVRAVRPQSVSHFTFHRNPTVAAARGALTIPHAVIPDRGGAASVYVSDYGANVVYGYAATGGSPTFTVSSGISGPQGLSANKKHLYVANTNDSQILVYTPPSTTPTTITDTGEFPAGVSVNAKGTAIWVSNICSAPSCTMGNLEEYNSSGTLVKTITCSNMYRYYFVGSDAKGNVAVDGEDSSFAPTADVIPAGSSTCTAITPALEFPGGVEFTTNGNLAIGDQDADTVTVYAAPSFSTVVSTTSLSGASDPVTFSFNKGDKDVWSANAGGGDATEYAFPAGGSDVLAISGIVEPIGVANRPAAKAK